MDNLKKFTLLKNNGRKVGFTASTFDLLHPGHIDMLQQASSQCDYLIVGLLTNPQISRPDTKQAPCESVFERWMRLQALSYVDAIIPFDTEEDLVNILNIIKPDVRFVGDEYKNTEHTGYDIKDIKIIYNERKHNWSSSNLKNKLKVDEK